MEAYQERVVQEERELREKMQKLEAFFGTEIFKGLPQDEQKRLNRQYSYMSGYREVLEERILNFPD